MTRLVIDLQHPEAVLENLRRAAMARPEDLALHLVYSDALSDAGDPLGELIQRQCVDPETEIPEAMSRQVLGALHGHAVGWRIVRGFLREVRLKRTSPRELRQLVGRPEWDGVTALSFARGATVRTQRLPDLEIFDLISHPMCSGLREVTDLDDETLRRVADVSRSFDRLGVQLHPLRDGLFGPVMLWAKVLKLSHGNNSIEWMLGAGRPLLERVEALELADKGPDPLMLLHDAGERLTSIEAPHVSATRVGLRWRVILTPARFTEHSVYWDVPQLVAAVRAVAARLASLEIRMPDYGPAVLDRIRLAARDVDFNLVLTGPAAQLVSSLYTDADADSPF